MKKRVINFVIMAFILIAAVGYGENKIGVEDESVKRVFDDTTHGGIDLSQGGFTICLASPENVKEVEIYMERFKKLNLPLQVIEVKTKQGKRYRVCLYQYENSKSAETKRNQLRKSTGVKDAYLMLLEEKNMKLYDFKYKEDNTLDTKPDKQKENKKENTKEKSSDKEKKETSDLTGFLNLYKTIVFSIVSNKYGDLHSYINPETGIYLIVRENGKEIVEKYVNFSTLANRKNINLQITDIPLKFESLPIYDCVNDVWSKEGTFSETIIETKVISKHLTKSDLTEIDKKELENIQNVEKSINRVLLQTGSGADRLKFQAYFSIMKGKWYMVAIDAVAPCN